MKALDTLPLTRWQRLGFRVFNALLLLVLMQWSPLWPLLSSALAKHTAIDWMALPAMERTTALLKVYPQLIHRPEVADALLPDLIGVLLAACVFLLVAGWVSRRLTLALASLWLSMSRRSPVVGVES